jgi:hypothetical protein
MNGILLKHLRAIISCRNWNLKYEICAAPEERPRRHGRSSKLQDPVSSTSVILFSG